MASKPSHLIEIEWVRLSGGSFVMGADHGRRDERPAHRVSLPPFRAASRPVDNALYRYFIEDTHSAPPPFWTDTSFQVDAAPVVGVSWFDAIQFCAWLTRHLGIECRLPTEAEREYAARGGLAASDWPLEEADWPDREVRASISTQQAPHIPLDACRNGYGLYCMADNVHEWCSDWYARDSYTDVQEHAPQGPDEGVRRASRGGSWRHKIKFTRVSARSSLSPGFRYNDYGFRVYANAT